jgi:hypothetical protein
MRPEVGQQREIVALALGPRSERGLRVNGNADQLNAVLLEQVEVVAQSAQFARARARERKREKHECYGLLTRKILETNPLAELVREFKIGCLGVVHQSH